MTTRTDTFNRSDSTTTLGTPSDGGGAWSALNGTWGISTNRAYDNGSNYDYHSAVLDAASASVNMQWTFQTWAQFGGAVLRASDASNYLLYIGDNVTDKIYTKIAGAYTEQTGGSATPANGDVYRFQATAANDIRVYKNGVSICSVTTSQFSTNTKHGLQQFRNGATSYFDDLTITDLVASAIVVPVFDRHYRARRT